MAVLRAYLDGLSTTYALVIAATGLAAVVSFAVEWKKINIELVMSEKAGREEKKTRRRVNQAAEAEEGEEEGAADYLSASSGSGFSDGSLVYEQEQASPNVHQGAPLSEVCIPLVRFVISG